MYDSTGCRPQCCKRFLWKPIQLFALRLLLLGVVILPVAQAFQSSKCTAWKSDLNAEQDDALSLVADHNRVWVILSDEFPTESKAIASNLSLPLISFADLEETENEPLTLPEFFLSLEPFGGLMFSSQTFALSIVQAASLSLKSLKRRRRSSSSTKSISTSGTKPFFVDFCPPRQSRLGSRTASGADLLTKAVAPRKGPLAQHGAVVYDLTAGFGQDSFLLAKSGAQKVVMFERNLIVGALLNDALRRLDFTSKHCLDNVIREEAASLSNQLVLNIEDGQDYLRKQQDTLECDIVYLDPMFPVRTKSASVKKNMQILHTLLDTQSVLLGDDNAREEEERSLVRQAFCSSRFRVVAKRPLKAPPLGGLQNTILPSYAISGSTNRWDVYVVGQEK